MAFVVRIEGADAVALERQATAEDRPVEDVVHDVIRAHLAHRPAPDLVAELAVVRDDEVFDGHLADVVERDRGILDRLAE